MSDPPSTRRLALDSTIRPGDHDDLAELLRRRPEFCADHSVLMNRARVDYRRRCDGGEMLTASQYCALLPQADRSILASIHRMVEVERYLLENPDPFGLLGDVRWPEPGERFGSFTLVEQLGQGAASRVFLATQDDLGRRRVVVKVTHFAAAEASVMGSIEHPNVVPVFSTGIDAESGLHWICMPYVIGETLQAALDRTAPGPGDRSPIGLKRAIAIGTQIADALAYLHDRGIRHGDLKPSNILLSHDGDAMLFDFNLSQDGSADTALVGGTLPYMAPELLAAFHRLGGDARGGEAPGSAALVATREADVYAFGCVLFEMVAGRPFVCPDLGGLERDQIAEVVLRLQGEARRTLARNPPRAPLSVARLIAECTASIPDERPADGRALGARLRCINAPRRWRLVVGGIGVLTTSVAVVAAWLSFQADPAARLESATRSLETGQIEAARKELSALADDPIVGPKAAASLATLHLDNGDFAEAAAIYEVIALKERSALAAAMGGYARHMIGQHADALTLERLALELSPNWPAVQNNLGAGLLSLVAPNLSLRESGEIADLLAGAHRAEPQSETIRYNALRHSALLGANDSSKLYDIVEILDPPLGACSIEYLRIACRQLALSEVPDGEVRRIGTPLLRELVAQAGPDAARGALGPRAAERYVRIHPDAFARQGAERTHPTGDAGPPVFLDPRGGRPIPAG